jgi:hypothetical protein
MHYYHENVLALSQAQHGTAEQRTTSQIERFLSEACEPFPDARPLLF